MLEELKKPQLKKRPLTQVFKEVNDHQVASVMLAQESPQLRFQKALRKSQEWESKWWKLTKKTTATRKHITDMCCKLRTETKMSDVDPFFIDLRNTVRILKGKNLL